MRRDEIPRDTFSEGNEESRCATSDSDRRPESESASARASRSARVASTRRLWRARCTCCTANRESSSRSEYRTPSESAVRNSSFAMYCAALKVDWSYANGNVSGKFSEMHWTCPHILYCSVHVNTRTYPELKCQVSGVCE